ncbi:MAG: hypothetical protein A2Y97_12440 [Nitrospirae bacterium RBG_13_39_12]|nr:MAG: hypothetical protein A2Y97_12440 [Nitrospirae bacterium RBG_13_39_12]
MYKYRGFLFILPFMVLSILFLTGCGSGGGEEYEETGDSSSPVAEDCLECHAANIEDTHYDLAGTAQIEGYILSNAVSWAPEGIGYILRTNENSCATSCHAYHYTDIADMKINRQWFKSGHADTNAEAFTHIFTSGSCLRCHSGIGYASYVDSSNNDYPGWVSPTGEIYAHHITCNACHDAIDYPTAGNKRLRKTGSVILTSGSSVTSVQDATLNVGSSASCFVCHQGTESGWSLYKQMRSKGVEPYDSNDETMNNFSFINIHYMPAGAMLFSLKGFEFSGKMYSNGTIFHQSPLCTGCHMADSGDEDLGGHTFNVSYEDKLNIAVCQGCHPGLTDFKTFRLYDRDMDGDGVVESISSEIDGLKALVIAEFEKAGIYYNPDTYPYFFTVPDSQTFANRVTIWKESQLEAAFNLHYIEKEPGAYIHNFRYAVQLLQDSYQALSGVSPPGVRPSSSDDRAATTYIYP